MRLIRGKFIFFHLKNTSVLDNAAKRSTKRKLKLALDISLKKRSSFQNSSENWL